MYDLGIFIAWHVEAFARTKRLPSLKKLLQRETKPVASPTPAPPVMPDWRLHQAWMRQKARAPVPDTRKKKRST